MDLGSVKGIGEARKKILEENGFTTVNDLVNYLPYAYEDSTDIKSIAGLIKILSSTSFWEIPSEKYTIKATVEKISKFRTKRGFSIIQMVMYDNSTEKKVKAIWFNQDFILPQLQEGSEYIFYGKIKIEGASIVFQSPKFELFKTIEELRNLGRVVPKYRKIGGITSTYIRKFVVSSLEQYKVKEYINEEILGAENLLNLPDAYTKVHVPEVFADTITSKRRLELQELLEIKDEFHDRFRPIQLPFERKNTVEHLEQLILEMKKMLPFALTESQNTALASLVGELKEQRKLNAFVYGDVGSGKTIVALLLAFSFCLEGYSAVLIAPTTILTAQHVKTAEKFIEILKLNEKVQISNVTAGAKLKINNVPTLYIGTHAILYKSELLNQKEIKLICIDEQHRFGVEQRAQLDQNNDRHVITLSATPIPRTLALSFLGFNQVFSIYGKPIGRKEVISKMVPFDKEAVTYQWINEKLNKGEQAFFVFPRVGEDGDEEKQSLISAANELTEKYYKNVKTGILYGTMKEKEKQEIMSQFAKGEIQLLFATTVVEVGVDVANATIIAIHGAEMFGMAQLHQLRGRVGRGEKQGFCFLFPRDHENEKGSEMLTFFSNNSDGFAVAEYDLNNRGMGTILGTYQSGLSELKIATFENLALVKSAASIYDKLKAQKVEVKRYIR